MKKYIICGTAVLALALTGCGPDTPGKTPQQVWIDAHPTHAGPNGECIEDDDEPCDNDPYDLDDWYEEFNKTPAVKKSSPKPMLTAKQPAPKTTKRR